MSAVSNGYPTAPLDGQDEKEHRRRLATVLQGAMLGQINVTVDLTLTANVSSTTLTDPRIGVSSAVIPAMAKTSDAAADLAAGIYVSGQTTGSAVINHRNNAATDRTIRFVIIG